MFDWQLSLALVCVVLAAAYLLRRGWRTWTRRGCGGCAKAREPGKPAMTLIPSDQIRLRRR
jgi:ABC-type uncharacterized transport system YnjBCD permease subunit